MGGEAKTAQEIKPDEMTKVADEMADKVVTAALKSINTKLAAALGDEEKSELKLSEDAETVMIERQCSDELKARFRKDATVLDPKIQASYVKNVLDAAAGMFSSKKAAITFNASTGKWAVDHRNLARPMVFSNKQEAEVAFRLVASPDIPKIASADGKFTVTHPNWKDPVTASTPEEVETIVADKLKESGWADGEAVNESKELVQAAQKEQKVMAGVDVKADTHQDVKDGSVSGLPTDVGGTAKDVGIPSNKPGDVAKQDVKNADVTVPGNVVVEKGDTKVLPAGVKTEHAIKFEDKARQHDKLVEQLKSAHGLKKLTDDVSKYLSPRKASVALVAGLTLLAEDTTLSEEESQAVAEALKSVPEDVQADTTKALASRTTAMRIKASGLTPDAQQYVSREVAKHREAGMEEGQAVAAAYTEAKKAGYKVPEPSK